MLVISESFATTDNLLKRQNWNLIGSGGGEYNILVLHRKGLASSRLSESEF